MKSDDNDISISQILSLIIVTESIVKYNLMPEVLRPTMLQLVTFIQLIQN